MCWVVFLVAWRCVNDIGFVARYTQHSSLSSYTTPQTTESPAEYLSLFVNVLLLAQIIQQITNTNCKLEIYIILQIQACGNYEFRNTILWVWCRVYPVKFPTISWSTMGQLMWALWRGSSKSCLFRDYWRHKSEFFKFHANLTPILKESEEASDKNIIIRPGPGQIQPLSWSWNQMTLSFQFLQVVLHSSYYIIPTRCVLLLSLLLKTLRHSNVHMLSIWAFFRVNFEQCCQYKHLTVSPVTSSHLNSQE